LAKENMAGKVVDVMADESNDEVQTPPPPPVNPTPPAQTPPPSDHVTKSEFSALSDAVANLTELVGKLVPESVDRDTTARKVP